MGTMTEQTDDDRAGVDDRARSRKRSGVGGVGGGGWGKSQNRGTMIKHGGDDRAGG